MDIHGHRNTKSTNLFRSLRPAVEATAKASAPVKPVSPAGNLDTVLKTMADGFAALATAVKGATPIQKAPAAPKAAPQPAAVTKTTPAPSALAAPAQRSTGNPSSVPLMTETMRRKEAEAKEAARKSAQRVAADRELVTKGTARVLAYRALDVSLSDNALLVLNHVVTAWEQAARRPIPLSFTAVADAVDLSFTAVRSAVEELETKKALIVSKDSAGVTRYQPGLGITGAGQ